jgi:hypothetical protein
MPGYRIVATGIKEFDYPKGNDNVYTSYSGKGGIPMDSFWKKALFAWTRSDVNILLTSYITTRQSDPDLAAGSRARGPDRSVLAARQRSLPRVERRQAVLDSGCLHVSDQYPYANPHRIGFGRALTTFAIP